MSAMGKIEKYYWEKVKSQGAMLFTLIDPDKCFLDNAAKLAKTSYESGADAILVGGSIGAQGAVLDETVKKIEKAGGKITTPKHDIGEWGMMADFKDPDGNEFSLWQPLQKK